jgi:hypothetical protein
MSSTGRAVPPNRWSLRYSLRTAFVVLVFAACLFATYRFGFERGRTVGPVVPTSISIHEIYTREYDVSDIANGVQDGALLVESVHATVDPQNWALVGGYAEISYNDQAKTLAVTHTWPGHVAFVRFLDDVRMYWRGHRQLDIAVLQAIDSYSSTDK